MNVRVVEQDVAVVVQVDGAIDGLTAPRLRDALRDAFDRLSGRVLVIDLSSVRFLGSPGLRALFDAASEGVKRGKTAPVRVVVDEKRPVIRPMEVVGLDGVVEMYHSLADAIVGP